MLSFSKGYFSSVPHYNFIIHACPGLTWPMASALKPLKGNCVKGCFSMLIARLFLQLSSGEGCSLSVSFPTLMFQELCPSVTILLHSLWEFSFPWYAKEKDNWILRTSSPRSSKEGWAIQVFPTLIFYFDHLINSFLLLSVSHKYCSLWHRHLNEGTSPFIIPLEGGQRTRQSLIIVLDSFLVNEIHRALKRHIKV